MNRHHRAVLAAAAEICCRDVRTRSVLNCWNTIAEWVDCDAFISGDSAIVTLSAMLCFAVDEECSERNTYIGRIMGLDRDVQKTLMQLINDYNEQKRAANMQREPDPDESYLDDLNIDDDNESLLDDDDDNKENLLRIDQFPASFGANRAPLSPKYQSPMISSNIIQFSTSTAKKLSPPPFSMSARNVSGRKVIRLEKETTALNERNTELLREMDSLRQQENMMRVRCEEMEAINRASRLRLESEALVRESDMRDELTQQILGLERELTKAQMAAKEASSAKEQLAGLQDEVDILQHSKMKLQHTENQMQKLKLKLEQMGDVSKALASEEKAHSDAVSKCLDIENELAALIPLKRQLEEYKARATNAEVRLVDCEDEVKKLREASDNISGLNNELQLGSLRQQAEAEQLRRTLEKNESEMPDGLAVGDGISELNPVLKEELLRLRSENIRLKAFAAKRADDSVQRLEEQLDDAKRLADRFKEQYLATKSTLETYQKDLAASLKREQELEKTIAELEETKKELEQSLQEERIMAQKAKLDATRTLHSTKKEMGEQAKTEKEQLVQEWESKVEKERSESDEKYSQLANETKEKIDALDATLGQLREQSFESLRKMEQEFTDKTTSLKKEHQEQVDSIQLLTAEERTKLIAHGKQVIQKKKEEANDQIQVLDKKLKETSEGRDQLLQAQKEYEQKVATKLQSYRQRLSLAEARAEENARECDEIEAEAKKLEREKSTLQGENDRFRRQLGGRYGSDKGQYEELQRNYNDLMEENRALKEKSANQTQRSDMANAFNLAPSSRPYSAGASVSASSLSQLRAEYEDKIEEINDEKRELVMKNSALITDEKKAQKRAWELEVEVKKLENSNTSLQLQLERSSHQEANLQSPPKSDKRSSSFSSNASKMWKGGKSSKKKSNKGSPGSINTTDSTEPMIDLKSPEFEKSVKKLKKGGVEGFKNRLAQRLSAKKKNPSPLKSVQKSMSLMDMAASGSNKLDNEEWELSFADRMNNM